MRSGRGLVFGLLLVLAVAGCGGTDDGGAGVATAGGAPSASASEDAGTGRSGADDGALEFSRCMRENGVPDFPDPKIGKDGEHSLSLPEGLDRVKVEAAEEKCRRHLPDGGEPPKVDPQVMDRMREYARCVRANGVPKFPDPVDGGLQLDLKELGLTGPDDPRLKAAEEACRGHLPPPPSGAPSPRRQTG